MKVLKFCSAALIFGSVLSFANAPSSAAVTCPDATLGEVAQDCPWGKVSREMEIYKTPAEKKKALQKALPAFIKGIQKDAHRAAVKDLWGQSLNYDEFAKGQIVDPDLLDVIFEMAAAPPRKERVVHAGLEHTYGYLLSVLKTPYGYKRARWVTDDIASGFGFSKGTLGPNPKKGTLFLNASYFASKLVHAESDESMSKVFGREMKEVSKELMQFDASKLERRRLIEELTLGTRKVELVTDVIAFKNAPKDPKANSHLLVYSVKDSDEKRVHLITLFPVNAEFGTKVFDPKNLGENQPIITRYNAFVAGVTGSAAPLKGTRKEAKE